MITNPLKMALHGGAESVVAHGEGGEDGDK
jgi:hypothetical protein